MSLALEMGRWGDGDRYEDATFRALHCDPVYLRREALIGSIMHV